MHTRHRSPGGIRSNSMGGGGGGGGGLAAARISPDTSLPRTLGYSRSFGGGGGRMMPLPPQPNKPYLNNNPPQPLPPPRRADILMEAGRLATEYLVSQGVLPPSVLADNKWPPNPNLNLNGTSSSFQLPDGRPSALARLGNGFPEEGGFRNRTRGRRRMNSSTRGYDSSEWGTTTTTRDNNTRKNGLFYQRPPTHYHPDMEGGGDDDLVPPQWQRDAQQQGDLDASSGVVKAVANDSPLKSDVAGDSESMLTNYEIVDDGGSKTTTSTTEKELNLETYREASNASDEMKILNMGTGDIKDGTSEDGLGKQSDLEDFSMHHLSVESDIMRKDSNGLLRLCDFARVPTKTRSSLSVKGSRVESVPLTETEIENEERNACVVPPPEGPKVSKEEDSSESLSNCMPEGQTRSSKCLDSDIPGPPTTQTVEDVEGLGSALALEKGESTASQYLPGSTVIREQASGEGLAELGRSNSVVKDRGDKRALENDDLREGSKKPKEWPSAIDACTDDYYHLHNFCANPSHSHKSNASEVEVVEIVDEERLFDVSLLPRGASESGIESKEEKQLFPSSFRICDLNLMESSDMSDTHDSGPVYGLPSTMQDKMGVQVDVDLTMSNSCNRSDDYDRSAADAKEAIVVDIEDDSAKEDEDFDTSERKNEIANSSLESFPNHMGNTGDLPDAQDGYGLMISELLGNDIPNCSSVPGDMTSMHTEMGLHNGAEILDDDDPIYLSLGEIPISFLGVWEQPTQPYEKPF